MRLLLASQSATRRTMLTQAGVPFEVVRSEFDEESAKAALIAEGRDAWQIAGGLAFLKAVSAEDETALVLGSDQVLECADRSLLSKPRSREELAAQLRKLSGATHRLHTAAVLTQGGEQVWTATETVSLGMRSLSDRFIEDYLQREWQAVRWNVGGYRIEGMGAQLFERIEGSHFAILGLPLLPLLAELRRLGVLTS